MTFSWLPDAELDPHPRRTWLAQCGFDLTVSALYRVEPVYSSEYRHAPGTLVVSNHLRDADVPILTTVLCRRKGFHFHGPMPFFASREDMLRRDFLACQLRGWPQPIRFVLGRLSLAWLFRIVRIEPLRRVREFTLAEAFAELPDTADNGQWLNDRGRYEMRTGSGQLSQANRGKPPDRRVWGLRRLRGPARRTLYPQFRATIAHQLDRLAALLDAGRMVYVAPEGAISQDGRFGRIRAGPWALVQRTATPPPILPLALSYDPLRAGRLRAIVHVGTPWQYGHASDRGRFDRMLAMQIRRLYPLNASHLASRFLVTGPTSFTTDDFAHWLAHAREQLRATDTTTDPQLDRSAPSALAAERLEWLQRAGLTQRTATGWHNLWPREAAASWQRPANIVRYCDNALDDHLQALAPGLSLRP